MYKVFFKDRIVFFRKDFPSIEHTSSGLIYRFDDAKSLNELLEAYFEMEKISPLYLVHEDLPNLKVVFSSLFKEISAGGGLVRNPEGELLFILRNGIWDLPKGKAEKGESIEETALREVKEECGFKELEVKEKITDTYHTYRIGSKKVLKRTSWFEMYNSSEEKLLPQTEEGITELRWVNPSKGFEFIRENTFPSILEVLKQADILF